jgi:riboflavin synthase
MFTGLVEDCGQIISISRDNGSSILKIRTALIEQIHLGDSVSVNGVCLTATKIEEDCFSADVMIQTLRLTSLGSLQIGDDVNLELAARADGRLGGHIVQGHVDATATVRKIEPGQRWTRMDCEVPRDITKYIVNQGSITIDGVSLTVGEVDDRESLITVWLIPETLSKTNLGRRKVGDIVNIEVDVLAKYVERLLAKRDRREQ